MTVYYTLASDGGDWNDPTIWTNGSVPDSANDGVILNRPAASVGLSYTPVTPDASATIASLNIFANNGLGLGAASLTVAGNVTVNSGGDIGGAGYTISAASFINSGELDGTGSIYTSGRIENYGTIDSAPFNQKSGGVGIALIGQSVYNTGTIMVESGSRMQISPTNFLNYSAGTLSLGTYEVAGGGYLYLGTPGTVTKLAATVILDDSNLDSGGAIFASDVGLDPPNAPTLQQSLTAILSSGTLQVIGGTYQTGNAITLDGTLALSDGATFSAASLVIGTHGSVTSSGGTVTNALVDNGAVVVAAGGSLTLNQVTGSGHIDLGASATLQLDAPRNVGAVIEHFAQGDTIDLTGIALSSVTGYSYHGGALTIAVSGAAPVVLDFAGTGYMTGSFALSAGHDGQVQIVGTPAAVGA